MTIIRRLLETGSNFTEEMEQDMIEQCYKNCLESITSSDPTDIEVNDLNFPEIRKSSSKTAHWSAIWPYKQNAAKSNNWHKSFPFRSTNAASSVDLTREDGCDLSTPFQTPNNQINCMAVEPPLTPSLLSQGQKQVNQYNSANSEFASIQALNLTGAQSNERVPLNDQSTPKRRRSSGSVESECMNEKAIPTPPPLKKSKEADIQRQRGAGWTSSDKTASFNLSIGENIGENGKIPIYSEEGEVYGYMDPSKRRKESLESAPPVGGQMTAENSNYKLPVKVAGKSIKKNVEAPLKHAGTSKMLPPRTITGRFTKDANRPAPKPPANKKPNGAKN